MGGGITAFLGATVFEIGSILLMLEAVNENRADCFGWALEDAIEGSVVPLLHPEHEGCKHSHRGKKSLFKGSGPAGPNAGKDVENQQGFVWWPSWYDLRTHYFRDVGFLACFFQMIGATIFWIAGFTSLPPIYDALSPYTPALNGAYWLPQVSHVNIAPAYRFTALTLTSCARLLGELASSSRAFSSCSRCNTRGTCRI